MKIFSILLVGICILIGAIILNYIASTLELLSWYSLLTDGKSLDLLNIIWLFIIYPFGLGLAGHLASKIFQKK